jgi:uncharacterized membrane protein YgcG
MPWDILQLDRSTATSRDVKRAYARQLKITRPDQDPEGFRKLHDAYQYALAHTEGRERSQDPGPALPTYVPVAALENEPAMGREPQPSQASNQAGPSASLQAVMMAFEPLEAALQATAAGVPELVRNAEQALYDHPDEAVAWGRIVGGLFEKYGSNKDLSLKPEAMLFELEHDSCSATYQVIERLDRQGRAIGITGLGETLLANQGRIGNYSGAIAAIRLACADAVWERSLGDALPNFAFPFLSSQQRNTLSMELDRFNSLGKVLQKLPMDSKLFWRDRLMTANPSSKWDDPASKAAIKDLQSMAARRWPGFRFLTEQLPAELRAKIPQPRTPGQEESWDRPSPGQEKRVRRSSRSHSPAMGGGGMMGGGGRSLRWIGGAAFWIVIGVLKACAVANRHY